MIRPQSTPTTSILIVEKHTAVRRALRKRLSATPDLEVLATVPEPTAAMPYFSGDCRAPDVVLLGLHSGSDEELFATLTMVQKMARCSAAVIILAPYADEVERLLLQQAGASSYLLKYIDSYRLIQEIKAVSQQGHSAVQGD